MVGTYGSRHGTLGSVSALLLGVVSRAPRSGGSCVRNPHEPRGRMDALAVDSGHVPVAQWTEQPPSKRKVAGSNPAGGARSDASWCCTQATLPTDPRFGPYGRMDVLGQEAQDPPMHRPTLELFEAEYQLMLAHRRTERHCPSSPSWLAAMEAIHEYEHRVCRLDTGAREHAWLHFPVETSTAD
jgi:hypothetical protein